jgi:blocked early in transport 1
MSSEAYERERQNNALLESLGGKVTALRDVTIDIYDNARDQVLIDSNVRPRSPSPSPSLSPLGNRKGAGRLTFA